ncbi:hypothetical protein MTO96_000063 [Rhipicephalus appendiculatus]
MPTRRSGTKQGRTAGWPGCLRCSPHRVAGSKFIRDTHCRRGVQWIELPPPGGRPRPATLALAFSGGTVSIWRAPAETCRRGFSPVVYERGPAVCCAAQIVFARPNGVANEARTTPRGEPASADVCRLLQNRCCRCCTLRALRRRHLSNGG